MQSKRKNRGVSKNGLIITCCVLSVILIAQLVVVIKMNIDQMVTAPSEPSHVGNTQVALVPGMMEEIVVYAVDEREDAMYVTTSYIDFTYPYAFSDLLVIEPINQENFVGLQFSLFMGKKEPVYTLWINRDQGMFAGVLKQGNKKYRVTIEMYNPREDLDETQVPTFYAVQETLNDVLQSMGASGDFVYTVGGEG